MTKQKNESNLVGKIALAGLIFGAGMVTGRITEGPKEPSQKPRVNNQIIWDDHASRTTITDMDYDGLADVFIREFAAPLVNSNLSRLVVYKEGGYGPSQSQSLDDNTETRIVDEETFNKEYAPGVRFYYE